MSTTAPAPRRIRRRLFAALAVAVLAGGLAPIAGPQTAAHAAGDVCDICSLNFDLGECENIGGWPYDSTLESPPPAVSGGAPPQQPAPQQPAPQPAAPQPAAPQPAAPQPSAPQTSTGGTGSTRSGAGDAGATVNENAPAVVATAPLAPTFTHEVSGRVLSLTWAAPADGGAALTGYKLILNGGTPIEIPADATAYELTLGAGTYDAVLIATNSVGESTPSAAIEDIEITGQTATPNAEKTPDASDAVAASDDSAAASPLAGVAVIGGLVVVAGALLGWWWLRRRRAATASDA
jgi:hypothetical protein